MGRYFILCYTRNILIIVFFFKNIKYNFFTFFYTNIFFLFFLTRSKFFYTNIFFVFLFSTNSVLKLNHLHLLSFPQLQMNQFELILRRQLHFPTHTWQKFLQVDSSKITRTRSKHSSSTALRNVSYGVIFLFNFFDDNCTILINGFFLN